MNVAVIPARGGSKRIPRKNIKDFCGKPMIAWPIEVAKQSELFDRIMVSTDDEEVAEISKSCGAEVLFMRPEELSDDHTGITEVIAHAISWMQEQKWKLGVVCCFYPTSVFLTKDDLKKGFDAMSDGNWSYAFSVTDYEYPIFRSFKENSLGGVEMFFPEQFENRSQDLTIALHDAAQFYWGKPEAWLNHSKLFDHHSYPVKIPRWRVQDIDTKDDWKRAEILFNTINQQVKKQNGK
jgi:N-acylneuraminate cytidylyltransferase